MATGLHEITFIRGPDTFAATGQIYVKMLPDGEPVQLTHDDSRKMGPVFSPDGSQIAYTALTPQNRWDPWVVPVISGQPRLWLPPRSGQMTRWRRSVPGKPGALPR